MAAWRDCAGVSSEGPLSQDAEAGRNPTTEHTESTETTKEMQRKWFRGLHGILIRLAAFYFTLPLTEGPLV